tara:strand:- start:12529 stop:15738 length:3210 start_codon:yes stop_codon:yes gene_type:complete
MSAVLSTPKTTSGGEIITNLINASDGAGLHFDGTSGSIGFTPPDLGTKLSFEFIIQADSWGSNQYLIDFGTGGRFFISSESGNSYNLGVFSVTGSTTSFGVKILDDLKVHHLVVTVDGTSAILYDNGNQVSTATLAHSPNIDSCSAAKIGANFPADDLFFNGTIYRARFWNKTLSSTDVTSVYESASIDFVDQWGSQTSKILNGTAWTGATGSTKPNSWTLGIAGTYTIDSSSGSGSEPALKISRSTNNTPYIYQVFTAEIGKKYRVKYRVRNIDATKVSVGIGSVAVAEQYNLSEYTSTSWADYEETFTATTTVFSVYVLLTATGGTQSAYIDSLVVDQIGCVSDFDLAYANPTQSTIVQNRSGSGDGTAAGGVTQISPIEQLNSKALSVGTSAASPPDGEISVTKSVDWAAGQTIKGRLGWGDGYVYVGSNTTNGILKLVSGNGVAAATIDKDGNLGVGRTPANKFEVHLDTNKNIGFSGTQGEVGNVPALVAYSDAGALASMGFRGDDLRFAAGSAERLRIDSAGNTTSGALTASTYSNFKFQGANTANYGPNIELNTPDGTLLQVCRVGRRDGGTSNDVYLRTGLATALKLGTNNATALEISSAGLTTVTNPSWPLKNELSNSGFDVWSNSTLEDVATIKEDDAASDDTSDWTQTRASLAFDTDHYEYSTSGGSNEVLLSSVSVTAGKLYRVSVDVKNGTGSTSTLKIRLYDGAAMMSPNIATTASFVTHTFVAEASATVTNGYVGLHDATAFANNIEFKNFSLKEVTPGCVATGDKGPDRWAKSSTLDLTRIGFNTTNIKGMYGCLMTTGSTNAEELHQPSATAARGEQSWYNKFRGRTVTLGCWLYADSDASNGARAYIRDQDGYSYATKVAANTLTWVEVTRTISTTAWSGIGQYVQLGIMYECGIAAKNCYVSQPILSYGSAIGSGNYSRPSGEIVWFESRAYSNKYQGKNNLPTQAIAALNLEADSNGKIPKGAKAVNVTTLMRDAGSAANNPIFTAGRDAALGYGQFQNSLSGLADDRFGSSGGVINCDSSGDIYTYILATGSDTFDIDTFYYYGVQLR